MKKHERVHKDEFFACRFCDKKYTQIHNRKIHEDRHHAADLQRI